MSPDVMNLVLALMEWVATLEARVHDLGELIEMTLKPEYGRNSG